MTQKPLDLGAYTGNPYDISLCIEDAQELDDPVMLAGLALHFDDRVLAAVSQNLNASQAVRDELVRTLPESIDMRVRPGEDMSDPFVEGRLTELQGWRRLMVGRSADKLLALNPPVAIRVLIAKDKNVDMLILETLLQDENPTVREEARITIETMKKNYEYLWFHRDEDEARKIKIENHRKKLEQILAEPVAPDGSNED